MKTITRTSAVAVSIAAVLSTLVIPSIVQARAVAPAGVATSHGHSVAVLARSAAAVAARAAEQARVADAERRALEADDTAASSGAPAAGVIPAARTNELAKAQRILASLTARYPRFLQGVSVTIGNASGYQAVSYYTVGRIVISPKHRASLERILSHEIWHIIDWRDNGRIDWRERVPPANAAAYR